MTLFLHALVQLMTSLGAALRIGGLILVVQLGWLFYMGNPLGEELAQKTGQLVWTTSDIWAAATLICLALYSLMAAVNWHRYILLHSPARAITPRLLGGPFWRYVWALIKLTILAACLGGVIYLMMLGAGPFVRPALAQLPPQAGFAIVVGLVLLLSPVVMRMFTILPGAAVGGKLGLIGTMRKTKRTYWLLLSGFIMVILLSMALGSLVGLRYIPLLMHQILAVCLQWFNTMLFLSFLTSFYGFAVEGRALSDRVN